MAEVWLVIDEAPRYSVSSFGRVRNDETGRILKCDSKGYQVVCLDLDDGRRFTRYVHRLVAKAFYDGWADDLEVNHDDTDKSNNYVGNLEWVTHAENQAHASRSGVMINSGRTKTKVRIIETGAVYVSQAECARAINGRQSSIYAVLSGRLNSHRGYTFEYV